MLRHNLLIFLRNIKKNKSTFFINVMGLSTSLACVLLIFLWVNSEISVDKFHENDDRLYQVMRNNPQSDGIRTSEGTQGLLASALAEEMPEVERTVAVMPYRTQSIVSVADVRIKAKAQFAGKEYFNVFSYRLIQGNKNEVLSDKSAVVISDELAMKLFQTTLNVVGRTVECDFEDFSGSYRITGVFEKPPVNSTAQFDIVYSYKRYYGEYISNLENWGNTNPHTYLLLKENAQIEHFNAKIKSFIKTKYQSSKQTLLVRKYSDGYLYNNFENGVQSGGRIRYVKLFSLMALFILIIACINFINLSTASASIRLKEIGVKKTFGARRRTLIYQHIGESISMAFLSLCIALLLVLILLPQFNEIMGKQLTFDLNAESMLSILGIIVFTGFLSGSYPAIYLSGFRPVAILKGKIDTTAGNVWIRKGLVVFQFVLSITFIVSVLVIHNQMKLIETKNLGYNRDNIIHFQRMGGLEEGLEVFLAEAKKIPGVVNAAAMKSDFTGDYGGFTGIEWPGKDPEQSVRFWRRNIDYDLIETLGIELVEGRSYSRNYGSEETTIICNEAAIELMGLKDPIGTTIKFFGEDRKIVGVVKNFHFQSLYEHIKPVVLTRMPFSDRVMVKMKAGSERQTIDQLGKLYGEFYQGLPFDFKYLDEDYQSLYDSEQRIISFSKYLTGLAIIISCLGLFGLATFTSERRRKEISIRKVLGQSAVQVTVMLSSDFAKLVVVAILIALPIAYLLISNWLSGFAYRIPLHVGYFLGAGLMALTIALLTVGSLAANAAQRNPADGLREE